MIEYKQNHVTQRKPGSDIAVGTTCSIPSPLYITCALCHALGSPPWSVPWPPLWICKKKNHTKQNSSAVIHHCVKRKCLKSKTNRHLAHPVVPAMVLIVTALQHLWVGLQPLFAFTRQWPFSAAIQHTNKHLLTCLQLVSHLTVKMRLCVNVQSVKHLFLT